MNADPDWNLHKTFRAAMQEGSLSGAARRLGLTEPTVARHIQALELAIGAELFLRSQRGLTPTDVALDLMPYAEALASTVATFMRAGAGSARGLGGTVRISASEVLAVERLPPILSELRRCYPALVLELVVSNAVDDLLRRDADIAVRMTPPMQQALVAKRLPSVELGLYARREYVLRRGEPKSMSDLVDHDLVGFDEETPAMRALVKRFPAFSRSALALRTSSDLAQLAAIRAGFGVGMCHVRLANEDPDLVRVLPALVAIDLELWIVMHQDLKSSARCRAVFDALVEGLTNMQTKGGPITRRAEVREFDSAS